jgi:hypothetical protein
VYIILSRRVATLHASSGVEEPAHTVQCGVYNRSRMSLLAAVLVRIRTFSGELLDVNWLPIPYIRRTRRTSPGTPFKKDTQYIDSTHYAHVSFCRVLTRVSASVQSSVEVFRSSLFCTSKTRLKKVVHIKCTSLPTPRLLL